MKIITMVLGEVGTNCYLVLPEDREGALVIDPADSPRRIIQQLETQKKKAAAILLTHGHFDHILAVDALREEYGCSVYVLREEQAVLDDPTANLSRSMYGRPVTVKADIYLEDQQIFEVSSFTVRVLHTPGHTVGGACYYFREAGILFSGDTLFNESIGRTDFPGGSMSALIRSIREKLLVLPDDTVVLSGHGPSSTIGHEKQYNFYIQ